MAQKIGQPGGRPPVPPRPKGARSGASKPKVTEDALSSTLGHLDEAHGLAQELVSGDEGGRAQSRERLGQNLAKMGRLVDTLHQALASAAKGHGPARQQALASVARSSAMLNQQLGHTPFAQQLHGFSEQLSALLAQEGLSTNVRDQAPARRPLPQIPQPSAPLGASHTAPPPLPPKIPLRKGTLSKREREVVDGSPSPPGSPMAPAAKLNRPPSQRASADKAKAFREAAQRQHGSIAEYADGLRLSRVNDTPEAQRQNRINYIQSLGRSSVYGGELEARVMAEMLGVALAVHQPHIAQPIMRVEGPREDAPVAYLYYQPNAHNPRLSHYDALVSHDGGPMQHTAVPGDGNCMFYSIAVSTNYRNARAINAAKTPNDLRAVRTHLGPQLRSGYASELSDEAVRRLLLSDIADDLRAKVAAQLRTGRYDAELDLTIISTLADL